MDSAQLSRSPRQIAIACVASGVVFVLGFLFWNPAPISSAFGAGLGLVGLLVIGRKPTAMCLGLTVGLMLGLLEHWRVHLSGASPAPSEGLSIHLVLDLGRGASVAIPSLLTAWCALVLTDTKRPASSAQ